MGILSVKNLSKSYTGKKALDDMSLEVPEGGIYGLLGPNGAGKTTLIRIINHITMADSGEVEIFGHPLTGADVASIGYLPEERGLYRKMRVGDQAMLFARLKGLSKTDARRALTEWFERLGIMSWWNKKVEELSKGMAQKVQFIISVLHQPRLLIFDEPFSGLDPVNAGVLRDQILRLRDQGATIIFSTHNMASVEALCDNITLINGGRNILSGRVGDIRAAHGLNRYRLVYQGDAEALRSAAAPFVAEWLPSADTPGQVDLALSGADARRPLLAAANQAVDISSFTPLLASMDDIFVKAVNQSIHNS